MSREARALLATEIPWGTSRRWAITCRANRGTQQKPPPGHKHPEGVSAHAPPGHQTHTARLEAGRRIHRRAPFKGCCHTDIPTISRGPSDPLLLNIVSPCRLSRGSTRLRASASAAAGAGLPSLSGGLELSTYLWRLLDVFVGRVPEEEAPWHAAGAPPPARSGAFSGELWSYHECRSRPDKRSIPIFP
jgi:hypothetical protein